MYTVTGANTTALITIDEIEPQALAQIYAMCSDVTAVNPIAIMPDTHLGKGCVIGFTMKAGPRINPTWIGVDIGCGVTSMKITKPKDTLKEIDEKIRSVVPLGFSVHNDSRKLTVTEETSAVLKKIEMDESYYKRSLGTLGGGNHFIEMGTDSKGNYWVTVHTGSRNFGKKICEYWESKANVRGALCEEDTQLYLKDMYLAQEYARVNRVFITSAIAEVLDVITTDMVESTHNFISKKDGIIRKGAIEAYANQRLLIPFNMRDGIILGEGKSNAEWNFSAPHGAGRVLSRAQAKKQVDMETFKASMEGIYSTSVNEATLDESPMAYKDAAIIEEAIAPTVTVLDHIAPILNIKA